MTSKLVATNEKLVFGGGVREIFQHLEVCEVEAGCRCHVLQLAHEFLNKYDRTELSVWQIRSLHLHLDGCRGPTGLKARVADRLQRIFDRELKALLKRKEGR